MTDLSIIIPVYNVEKYLDDCLQSILPQLNEKTEVFLIDDGSTDSSSAICDRYARIDRVSVVHKENGGLSSARNCGIEKATGRYLFFADSDDLLTSIAVNTILSKLAAAPDVIYIGVEEKDEELKKSVKPQFEYGFDTDQIFHTADVIDRFFDRSSLFLTLAQGKVVSRNFILKNELYFKNGVYHEDDEWIARLLACEPTIGFVETPCYVYRHREGSIITSGGSDKIFKKNSDKLRFVGGLLEKYCKKPSYGKAVKYFAAYYMSALAACNRIDSARTKEIYRETAKIMDHMKYSENSKQKMLYYIYKVLGRNAAYKFITSRY